MRFRVLFLLLVGVSCAFGGMEPSAFSLQKKLLAPKAGTRDVASVELDEEVLAATTDNYSNLRIFDSKAVETPVHVRGKRRKRSEMRERSVSMKSVSLKELPDNRIEIVLVQKDSSLSDPGAIIFSTSLKNFEKQVSVFGSNDKSDWKLIVEKKPIFDYSRFFDIQNKRIDISDAKYKYFKLDISNISEKKDSPIVNIARDTRKDGLYSEIEKTSFQRKDFKIDKISFMAKKLVEVKTSQVIREYTVRDLEIENRSNGKETLVTFAADNVPLTKLTLLAEDANFSRSVRLEGSDNRLSSVSWKHVAKTTLTKIRMGKFSRNSTSVHTGRAVRYKFYRLTITNHDSPPLAIKELKAEGEVHEAVFFCDKALDYRLLYGGAVLSLPKYDIAAVLQKTDGEDTDLYSLGVQEDNPDAGSGGSPFSINSKTALVVGIVIMIAVLLWVITKAMKSMDGLESA